MEKQIDVIEIPGLRRIEITDKHEMGGLMADITHAVYPHAEVYGGFCPIQAYINCPPEKVFEYMSNPYCLREWTYSMRDFEEINEEGLFRGKDKIGKNTDIYFKVKANKEALLVDYHCAWDQGDHLWMIYLNRIVAAETVLNRPGTIVFWQNCYHPNYEKNPFPNLSPEGRPWVGDFWDFFYAGHTIELGNLKAILEFRHENNLPISPKNIK